jgi:hypothetical protein
MSNTEHRNFEETADFVINQIRALGHEPHPQSRLLEMQRLVKNASEIPPNDRRFDRLREAYRDFQYLELVFEQEHAKLAHPGLVERLQPLCLDATLPQDGIKSNKSKGRDTQLELFAAALCQAGALHPVGYDETTDVTCDVDGVIVGIPCKRLKSVKRTVDRIKEARDQIIRSAQPGVIVVDTTIALNPLNGPLLTQMSDDALQPLYLLAMRKFLDEHIARIRLALRDAPVIGVIFHDSVLRFEPSGQWSVTALSYHLPLLCSTLEQMRLYEAFRRRYLGALPNVENLDSH